MPLTLATPTQLMARPGQQGLDVATAAQAIADASSLVRAVSGQVYDFTADDTVTLRGAGRELTLPQRPPIVDVDHPLTVREVWQGHLLSPALIEGYQYQRVGSVLQRMYVPWREYVQVTYSHGYTVAPDWLTTLVLDTAVMYCTNPQGLRSETVGQITQVWARESVTNASDTIAEFILTRLRMIGQAPARSSFMIRPSR